jgi:hypothetical protein
MMDMQKSTWEDVKKREKLPFRGYQKVSKDMDEPNRKGAEVWNEMVDRLIEVNEMKDK